MENGKSFTVPLDSAINIKSEDMLEDIQNPTFIDNPQEYQGRYLPTSLRYERNGWAAGDSVYNVTDTSTYIKDDTNTWTVEKYFITDNVLQLVFNNNIDESLSFTVAWMIDSIESDLSVAILSVQGNTTLFRVDYIYDDGTEEGVRILCDLSWNGISRELTVTSDNSSDYEVTCTFNNATNRYDIHIKNTAISEVALSDLQPACYMSLDDAPGTNLQLYDVDSDANLVFKYSTGDDISVDKDMQQCSAAFLSGVPATLVNDTATFNNVQRKFDVKNDLKFARGIVGVNTMSSSDTSGILRSMFPVSFGDTSYNTNCWSLKTVPQNAMLDSNNTERFVYGWLPFMFNVSVNFVYDTDFGSSYSGLWSWPRGPYHTGKVPGPNMRGNIQLKILGSSGVITLCGTNHMTIESALKSGSENAYDYYRYVFDLVPDASIHKDGITYHIQNIISHIKFTASIRTISPNSTDVVPNGDSEVLLSLQVFDYKNAVLYEASTVRNTGDMSYSIINDGSVLGQYTQYSRSDDTPGVSSYITNYTLDATIATRCNFLCKQYFDSQFKRYSFSKCTEDEVLLFLNTYSSTWNTGKIFIHNTTHVNNDVQFINDITFSIKENIYSDNAGIRNFHDEIYFDSSKLFMSCVPSGTAQVAGMPQVSLQSYNIMQLNNDITVDVTTGNIIFGADSLHAYFNMQDVYDTVVNPVDYAYGPSSISFEFENNDLLPAVSERLLPFNDLHIYSIDSSTKDEHNRAINIITIKACDDNFVATITYAYSNVYLKYVYTITSAGYNDVNIAYDVLNDKIYLYSTFTYVFNFVFYGLTTYIDSVLVADYLVSYNKYSYVYITHRGVTFDLLNMSASYKGIPGTVVQIDEGIFSTEIAYMPYYNFNIQLKGFTQDQNTIQNITYNNNKDILLIGNVNYTFSSLLLDNTNISRFRYERYKVDTSGNNFKSIMQIEADKELQFLKQQWDASVETETFWWIDSIHILRLTSDSLVYLENNNEVDDWNGNKWNEVNSWNRYDYINNKYIRYGVSCAKNSTAVFYNMYINNNTIVLQVYDVTNNMNKLATFTFSVNNVALGQPLNSIENTSTLNTYSATTAYDILSDSKLSCTVLNHYLLFGIHYDNNFNQWAISIDLYNNRVLNIIQGYGFVGIDGSLTGGEIPVTFFDSLYGFNSTVYPISDLYKAQEGSDFNNVIECDKYATFTNISSAYKHKVFGADAYQYYIDNEITGIVSHLLWNSGSWQAEVLPLSNSMSSGYYSDSFGKCIKSDYETHLRPISDIIPDDSPMKFALNNIMDNLTTNNDTAEIGEDGGSDSLRISQSKNDTVVHNLRASATNINNNKDAAISQVMLALPRVTTALYLQQSAGQYSYVHYNNTEYNNISTEGNFEDVEGTAMNDFAGSDKFDPSVNRHSKVKYNSKLVFDKKTISQDFTIQPIAQDIASAFTSALSEAPLLKVTPLVVNKLLSSRVESSDSNISDLLSNYASDIIDNLTAQSNMAIGNTVRCKSSVNSSLSLDMFYSTSDTQHICAGRGYVNHNFVAQATAQSMVSNQFEYNQFITYWVYKSYTTWPFELMKGLGAVVAGIGDGWADTATWGAAWVGATMNTVGQIFEYIGDAILSIYDTIFSLIGADNGEVRLLSNTSTHDIDVEGTHKYGNKSEHFMWPSFGVSSQLTLHNEKVSASYKCIPWTLTTQLGTFKAAQSNAYEYLGAQTLKYIPFENVLASKLNAPESSKYTLGTNSRTADSGETKYLLNNISTDTNIEGNNKAAVYIASILGKSNDVQLPANMACIIGTDKILPETVYKDKNVGVENPTFTTPVIHDYMLDNNWQISCTATDSMTLWIGVKDTKLIDGEFSNIVVSDAFCGIASPYTAIEVKRGIQPKYIRPTLITPEALAFNQTGYNCIYQGKMYHAFDCQGYRTVEWIGDAGINKEGRTLQYNFIVNDRFKRSNKLPPNEVLGNFISEPVMYNTVYPDDKVHIQVTNNKIKNTLQIGAIGEDKDSRRYAIPVFSEYVNTLPATVKTISPIVLSVIDGITSLTTDNRNLQSAYKVPTSVDFTINKTMYRMTSEYISQVAQNKGVEIVEDLVPALGLTFIGATPYEAYFYSDSTKLYYRFTGGTSLQAVDTVERFRSMIQGRYNFITQDITVQFNDRNDSDKLYLVNLKANEFKGNVFKAIPTIYNASGYKLYSLPTGLLMQGPNRCIINRYIYNDYMLDDIKNNIGKWERVDREDYSVDRKYVHEFETVVEQLPEDDSMVTGWTYNPFSLVISPLGISQDMDCIFEWEIIFVWTDEMSKIYDNKYATVCITSDSYEEGGVVTNGRPTHIYLTKELFTRSGCYGYYTFRYQSRCGAGNREKLKIWSDQYIAISDIRCEAAVITERRQAQLTQHVDVQQIEEL